MALLQVLLLFIFTSIAVISACEVVGSIEWPGEDIASAESHRLYVNFEDPAECSGQVYGWHVCVPEGSNAVSPGGISIAMYSNFGGDDVRMVTGSYTELGLDEDSFNYYEEYRLQCAEYYLESSDYFRVKSGAMVAACWEDFDTGLEFAVENEERSLWGFSVNSCSEEAMSFPTEFSSVEHTALLLTALINTDECRLRDSCHENASCSDVVGGENSYNCTCNTGFTGDGLSCVEIDSVSDKEPTENGADSKPEQTTSSEQETEPTVSSESSNRPQEKREGGGAGVVGAAVAATVVALLIIVVVIVSVLVYLCRRKIERALIRTLTSSFSRRSTKKRSDTLNSTAVVADTHDYDYVTVARQQGDNQYELVVIESRTPAPALTRASLVKKTSDYEIPVQTLPHSTHESEFGQLPIGSIQYETMLSAPSVKLEMEKESRYAVIPQNRTAYASLIQQTVEEHMYESLKQYQVPASRQESLYAQLDSYCIRNILRGNLIVVSELGTGQFGKVSKALWTEGDKQVEVAVKTLTNSANTVKFLQEAAIMAQFRHPNILTLHGVVSVGDPKIIVFELMHNGELKSVVTEMRPTLEASVVDDAAVKLLEFSKQVALGLHYLSCRGFVHRDLAARNILVTKDYICKIADFGLSRDLGVTEDDIYVSRGGKIPLKWCAPEAIFRRNYSTASDMWSYGCVLYEIWSLGHKPFELYQNKQVMQLLKKGYRLPPPPGCPKTIYKLMIDTWHPDAGSRPQPRDVLKSLLGSVDEVLAIPADVPAGSQAAVLGAPLDKATHLYQDLQNTYTVN